MKWTFLTRTAAARRLLTASHLVILSTLFVALPVSGLELPVSARVLNVGGYCTWASLDTLARANGIEQLRGVMDERREQNSYQPDPGYDDTIEAELQSRGVRYEMRKQWSFETELLDQYADKHGVAVSLIDGNPWSIGCHTIVVTKFTEEIVEFYDSSRPVDGERKPKIWRCGREWFNTWWLGSSVVVFPDDSMMAG